MRKLFIVLSFFYSACRGPEEKESNTISAKPDTTVIENRDANAAIPDTAAAIALPAVKKIKSPTGIYHTVLPVDAGMNQTIAFNRDFTYLLQEEYDVAGDSVVITEGTWTPSDGFIWLYKDQIVRGRYKWKGDTLQYFSPVYKKNFSMRPLRDAMQDSAWKNKSRKGIALFAVGTEPSWSVQLDSKDSITFQLPEWEHPLRARVDSTYDDDDSSGYFAKADTVQLRVTIFPRFCNDGMSDFIYRNRVKVQYNQQTYSGCAILKK